MTVHTFVATQMLDRMMAEPEGLRALHAAHLGLRDGRWSDEYIAAVGQHGVRSRSSWSMPQVAAFATVHGMIAAANVWRSSTSAECPSGVSRYRRGKLRICWTSSPR